MGPCKGEAITMSGNKVIFPNAGNTGDCVGDALRGQKKDPSKYYLDINADGTLTFHSDGYPPLKLKPASSVALSDPSGSYEGSVPLVVDVKMKFNGDNTADLDINVKVAHQDVPCKAEAITVTGSKITFPNAGNTGDCVGDALRGQKKDPSKYYLDINPDGTLTFHSDGYPPLKLKPSSTMALSDPSGSYEGSVPLVVDVKMKFNGDNTADLDINVKVAHQDVPCKGEAIALTGSKITFPNAGNTGDCVGDALRGQKKDPSKYYLDINADGTLTFHSDGYPPLKLKRSTSLALSDPSGSYEGSVPLVVDVKMKFNGDKTADLDINVKVAHQDVPCNGEAIAVTGNKITFPNASKTGDCVGDALRGQKKDPSKYYLDVNVDGSLTFHSDGYPPLKLRQSSQERFPETRVILV